MTENEALHLLAACYETEVNVNNRECRFDSYTVKHLAKIAKAVTCDTDTFGMMFGGTYGNGKTTMLYAFRRAVVNLHNSGYLRDERYPYWEPQFEIYEAVDFADIVKDRKEFKRVCSLNMLGIDDLGVQQNKVFDWGNVQEPIKRVLEARYNKRLYTVITTNQPRKDREEQLGERIEARISEMFYKILFSPEVDYRKETVINKK